MPLIDGPLFLSTTLRACLLLKCFSTTRGFSEGSWARKKNETTLQSPIHTHGTTNTLCSESEPLSLFPTLSPSLPLFPPPFLFSPLPSSFPPSLLLPLPLFLPPSSSLSSSYLKTKVYSSTNDCTCSSQPLTKLGRRLTQ